ncbi:MAG: hypothetical protein ACP5H2_00240 [Solirubrobacteraceae bacterium]
MFDRDTRRWIRGLRNLPFREFAKNQVWPPRVMLAQDLIAITQQLCLKDQARRRELKRLEPPAGAPVRPHQRPHTRRTVLRLSGSWPWAGLLAAGKTGLLSLRAYGFRSPDALIYLCCGGIQIALPHRQVTPKPRGEPYFPLAPLALTKGPGEIRCTVEDQARLGPAGS